MIEGKQGEDHEKVKKKKPWDNLLMSRKGKEARWWQVGRDNIDRFGRKVRGEKRKR
jgi:hypothetical protein